MMAAAFAGEGEFDAARTLMREERRVLLAIEGGRIDRKTLRYAVNTCRRIGADLDILSVSLEEVPDLVFEQWLAELRQEGIRCRMRKESGCLHDAVIDYTNARKEVLFVVIGAVDNPEAGCKGRGKGLAAAWQGLRCPLVVVADNG